ncbi:SNase-domain-containing protein [Artomyces pyxidatus]|uniref:SNase-domain-containing protein n=1 Tax=Artomyces pyxidatus TaxID=48021 RepID=A0ACB8T4W0_9AGAM|nr:SNase-domain-containing protein [Artomyces pyxidatus]
MPSLSWPSWSKSTSADPPEPAKPPPYLTEDSNEFPLTLPEDLKALPAETLVLAAFLVGSASTLAAAAVHKRYVKRIPNSEWITPDIMGRKRWIKGVVTSVGDADNFRIYHTPGIGWKWPLKFRRVPSAVKELKDKTIHIRMAGVDAPEAAHFGRPAQPYAEEALSWLKNQVEGKTVYCQVLRKDQYSRIVAIPLLSPRIFPGFIASGKCIPLEMLRAGWVEVYEQSGAEYGRWGKDEFMRIQAEAQTSKRGMWKHGTTAESPSEYKRRYRTGEDAAQTVTSQTDEPATPGLFGRLLSRLFGPRS